MPQLDFSTFASQIFWLIVCFSALYFILSRYSLPNIREVLYNRQSRIANDLQKAESLKEEAESAQADFTSLIADSRQKASKLLNDSRLKAEKDASKKMAKLEESFVKRNKEAEQKAALIKLQAREQLLPIAAEVASQMAKKVANINVPVEKSLEIAKGFDNN